MKLARVSLALCLFLGMAGSGMAVESHHAASESARDFSLDLVRWRYRLLVLGAADDDHPAIREQLAAVDASRAQFDDRDLLLVVLLKDAGSSVGGRPLTNSEAEQLRAETGIPAMGFALRLVGKDGGVKLARSKPVPMEEIYALIDTMPMRRSEMKREP